MASSVFCPDWVSHPSKTLTDLLERREWTPENLAQTAGIDLPLVEGLLDGSVTINETLADLLACSLGVSQSFWLRRQRLYSQRLHDCELRRSEAQASDWVRELPILEMKRFGWLPASVSDKLELAKRCLEFFSIESVSLWRDKYTSILAATAFRKSSSFNTQLASTAAWLRASEIISERTECADWDEVRFLASLERIKTLTRVKSPTSFLPKLKSICLESGVVVAIVPAPSGCRASGAAKLVSEKKGLISLTFRHLTDDHFWFTFFHEAGHLLLHKPSDGIVDLDDQQIGRQEIEANEFAQNTLIPQGQIRDQFLKLSNDHEEIIRFSQRAGISPGIVVGQLQHSGRVPRNHQNGLKRKYQWNKIPTQ